MDTKIGQTTLGEVLPYFVVIGVIIVFIVFCIAILAKTTKAKKIKKGGQKKLTAQDQYLTIQLLTKHTYGLPIAEGLLCTIQTFKDHFDFISGTTHISLSRDKITDMCVKKEIEIQQQYISSIGGAVGGAVLFGPLGAMIGGRAKKKTDKTITSYLIITYKNDAGIEYLGFDVSDCILQAFELVEDFRRNNINGDTHIEL